MAKLHEMLAVERDLKLQAEKVRGDLINLFEKKSHHFTAKIVTFKPLDENVPPKVEEQLDIQTGVMKELAWASSFIAKAIDSSLSIANANREAVADIEVGGGILAVGLPATFLLELEKKILDWRELAMHIPTLDPTKGYKPDEKNGEGVFQARVDARERTKKVQTPLVLYGATKEHPAQTQIISQDIKVGTVEVQEWSSMITPAQKARIISNIEVLLRAVKKARARANEVEVKKANIGKSLFDFCFNRNAGQDEVDD